MAELGVILVGVSVVTGVVSSVVGGYSLVATAVNNDGIWYGLPPQVRDAIRGVGMAPGR